MEEEKTNKHGKRKTNTSLGSLTIGGEGGIPGLLVFGGALAIAGFMAVTSFATKKNKKKSIHPHHQQLLLDQEQLRDDVTFCLTSNECNKTVTQPLILEEKIDNEPNSACFHHQEIAFSDYSHPESGASSNENGVIDECSVSLFNKNSGDCEQEEENDEPQDGQTTAETEDDDVDINSDDVTETDEEDSSEATEITSIDDNEELIEDEFKKYYCVRDVCSGLFVDDDSHFAGNEDMTVQKEATLNKTASFSVVQHDQPSIWSTWVMPTLLLGLFMLLLLLTSGLKESLYVFDDGGSVIVL